MICLKKQQIHVFFSQIAQITLVNGTMRRKTAPFNFCVNLVKSYDIEINVSLTTKL